MEGADARQALEKATPSRVWTAACKIYASGVMRKRGEAHRTFSECTTAPCNDLISGCYPLDKYYTAKPENAHLKDIKKRVGP